MVRFLFMYQTGTCVHLLQYHSHIRYLKWNCNNFSYYFNMIFSKRISGGWSICLVFVTLETHALWMQSYSLWGKVCWHFVLEWSNMYLIEKMLSLKKYKLTMNDEASSSYGYMFISKGNSKFFHTNKFTLSQAACANTNP